MKVSPEILQKYEQGTCTAEEKRCVEHWLQEGDGDAENYPEPPETALLQERKIWNGISGRLEKDTATKPAPVFFSKRKLFAAAACVVIIFTAATWLVLNSRFKGDETFASTTTQQHNTQGDQKKMVLADNSTVRLNTSTRIEVPNTFDNQQRNIRLLEGEAYFEIAKDSLRPFTVRLMDASIKVLGTKFNVNLRAVHQQTQITLSEGKIAFTTSAGEVYLLQPGQQLIYDTLSKKVTAITATDAAIASAWTEGKMIFRNTHMETALHQLALKHNMTFVINDASIKEIPLTASFSNESFHHVLHMIELASGIHFNKKDNVIQVSK